jgi:hypothetical protein
MLSLFSLPQKILASLAVIGLTVLSGYLVGRSHERAGWNKWVAVHAEKAQSAADAATKAQAQIDKFASLQPARIKQIETRYVTKSNEVKHEIAALKTQADTLGAYMECPLNCRVPPDLTRLYDNAVSGTASPDVATPSPASQSAMRSGESTGRDAVIVGGDGSGKWAARRAMRRATGSGGAAI